jgi:hypothetical protein
MSSDSKVCLTRRDPREVRVNNATEADLMRLMDNESPQQPVGPFAMIRRLSDELRAASSRMSAQCSSPQIPIIVAYRLPDNYHPRRLYAAPFVPIDEHCHWWRIIGMKHFGVTADARLTIDDSTHRRPAAIQLRTFQFAELDIYQLVKGLQLMSPEPSDEP